MFRNSCATTCLIQRFAAAAARAPQARALHAQFWSARGARGRVVCELLRRRNADSIAPLRN
eukprot:5849594-Lingulodinium_polyedra.AAC.1